jgi:hypothetical protein
MTPFVLLFRNFGFGFPERMSIHRARAFANPICDGPEFVSLDGPEFVARRAWARIRVTGCGKKHEYPSPRV